MPRKRHARVIPTTGIDALTPPYAASWFDRFTTWVDGLPGPPWVFYLTLAAATILGQAAIQWEEGAYALGTLYAVHVFACSVPAYLLALMHYLDKSAASALESFRPLLVSSAPQAPPSAQDASTYRHLSYQLTVLPARPALAITFAGATFALANYTLRTATGDVPLYLAGTAGTSLSIAAVMLVFVLDNALAFLLLYHTIHQLVQISQLYTKHARINIFHLRPLYALSLPGAFTGIGIILFIYALIATSISSLQSAPSRIGVDIGIAFTLTFAAIAGATFVLPLMGAHRRILDEKDRRLADIALRFDAITAECRRELERGRFLKMQDINRALTNLDIEQATVRRISTWPWEPGAVRSLLAALLLPIAVWLIQLLLARLIAP